MWCTANTGNDGRRWWDALLQRQSGNPREGRRLLERHLLIHQPFHLVLHLLLFFLLSLPSSASPVPRALGFGCRLPDMVPVVE
jgi:hypothetical protein